jgi:hydrogenase nickel incorporation protein HypA/HybF
MHEVSLVRTLISQARAIVATHGGGRPRAVRVQVGPLAGVEPALMATAWRQLQDQCGWPGVDLQIEEVPLTARCEDCGLTFEPVNFRFRCPGCGGGRTREISGDGVVLESIVLDDAEEESPV